MGRRAQVVDLLIDVSGLADRFQKVQRSGARRGVLDEAFTQSIVSPTQIRGRMPALSLTDLHTISIAAGFTDPIQAANLRGAVRVRCPMSEMVQRLRS
jgi:hypothetical protein